MRSRESQLRLPRQAAPVDRTLTGSALVPVADGYVVPARRTDQWCEMFPLLCKDKGGSTGPTLPTPPNF